MPVKPYRKKPVVIHAIQFDGTNGLEIARWATASRKNATIVEHYDHPDEFYLTIHTLEGTMRAEVGDWIIRGVQGEFYPCKPEIFAETYDAVDSEE